MSALKFSVLINNYNYADYVAKAVRSASAQAYSPHQIIVVDDGSNDGSPEVLAALQAEIANLVIHSQANGGQLSAFRKGIEMATGDWCFFLDADDEWTPEHLADAAAVIAGHPQINAYYSGHSETSGPPMCRTKWPEGVVGPAAALVAATATRIGTITSTIGLRRDMACKAVVLDHTFDEDWRIRADDCLLFGASLAGAVFYHHPATTVRYRIHDRNGYANTNSRMEEYLYCFRRARMLRAFMLRYGIEPGDQLPHLRTEAGFPANRRVAKIFRRYLRAIWRTDAGLVARLKYLYRAWRGR